MRRFIFIAALLPIVGCESDRTINRNDPICDHSTVDKRAEFTLSCISNANPKSDEEPEDWIRLCQKMAIKNYCPSKPVTVIQNRVCNQCPWVDESVKIIK